MSDKWCPGESLRRRLRSTTKKLEGSWTIMQANWAISPAHWEEGAPAGWELENAHGDA